MGRVDAETNDAPSARRPARLAALHPEHRDLTHFAGLRGHPGLRAETTFNVSTEAEQYGWDDLHAMSHGEALLWIAMNEFDDNGLYILDEPEAALSPQRQLSLLVRIQQLVKAARSS